MQDLKNKITEAGLVGNTDILNVAGFISNMTDPKFMEAAGKEIASQFLGQGVTKVVTIESSGIAPALYAAGSLGVQLVIMKKHASAVLSENLFQTEVNTYATGRTYELSLAADCLGEDDHVLIVDDILADGEAVTGAMRLIRKAHATIAGVSVLIEKSYLPGHDKIASQGIPVYPLAAIESIEDGVISFK